MKRAFSNRGSQSCRFGELGPQQARAPRWAIRHPLGFFSVFLSRDGDGGLKYHGAVAETNEAFVCRPGLSHAILFTAREGVASDPVGSFGKADRTKIGFVL
jgi:hypothetical protein